MAQEYKQMTSGYDGAEGSAPVNLNASPFNPYANIQTSLSCKPGKCKKGRCIGRVTIATNFVIEFTMTVHGKTGDSWESILHIGDENNARSPGIWLYPKLYKLHVRLSDVYDKNKGYDPTMELEKGGIYNIKFQCIDGTVSLYINNKLKSSSGDVVHITRFLAPVWCGDPWYDAANVTIENLNIYAPINDKLQAQTMDSNMIIVLAIDHAHGSKYDGMYFHFDKKNIESYLLRPLKKNERFKVCVKRTNYTGSVMMWPTNNGGSRGNAHGRFDKDPIGEGIGYFKVGDQIEILNCL